MGLLVEVLVDGGLAPWHRRLGIGEESVLASACQRQHRLVFQVRSALQAAAAAATDAAKPSLRLVAESVENLDGVPR